MASDSDKHNHAIAPDRRRGRGAQTNRSGRYERLTLEDIDDGWDGLDELAPFQTHVQFEKAKRIITTNDSPDIGFDQSINPYRGCEHGCSYCYARPTHAFMGLSPGLDFESRLYAKANAAELLERELANPRYVPKIIALGTNTDPYQPIEKQYKITRQILEVLDRANNPVGIVTKSALVTRDIDILAEMASRGLAKVALSVTTLDRQMARKMEPRASTPQKRLEALCKLHEAGIPTVVMVAPIVPAINDSEIEKILETAADIGVEEAGYVLLRLPLEVRDVFKEWLEAEFPNRAARVFSILRSMRDGKDYKAEWGERMRGKGPYADQIALRFDLALKRYGLNTKQRPLRTDLFTPPVLKGQQMRLF